MILSKRIGQKRKRVYAVTSAAEAAVFACPFHDENAKIFWKEGKMHLDVFDKSVLKKYSVSIYVLSSKNFASIDESNLEWYAEKPVKVLKEISVKDAIRFAEQNGVIIL